MEKFCVFCGKKPTNKNKEHVIPRWLIEYTGEINRRINVGFDSNKHELRTFSFNQLTLPACEQCNFEFGKIEAKVKPIIISLIEKGELVYSDTSLLLDWVDKVRVGLWLLFYTLDNNSMDIGPNFFINNHFFWHQISSFQEKIYFCSKFFSLNKNFFSE